MQRLRTVTICAATTGGSAPAVLASVVAPADARPAQVPSSSSFPLVATAHTSPCAAISHPISGSNVQRRSLMIRPQGTVDPIRFPLGYISLTGRENVETIYEMIKDGHYVVARDKIEAAHTALKGVADMMEKEHIVSTINDAIYLQNKKQEILSRILIRRDFWTYEDFNDPRMNQSFGMQNIYFDNYQWSQHLWPQFQTFAEKWFPTAEHSHLTYREYITLIMYFAAAVKGIMMRPLLPASHRIKPPFGVPFPTRANREPITLYTSWLQHFRAPLALNKALIVRGGCGIVGMATAVQKVPMVRVCDPSPLAIEAAREDAKRFGYMYRNMSFMTAEMFPPLPSKEELMDVKESMANPANRTIHANVTAVKEMLSKHTNYSLITLHADMPILRGLTDGDPDYHFAPGLQGYSKHLEQFFEQADQYLANHGVIAIICTNLYNLAYPDRPNPIEYEIKVNRRWVLMDYYDRPMRGVDATAAIDQWSANDIVGATEKGLKTLKCFKNKLRSELWILHKVEALEEFGWIHGVPGAKAPSHILKHWKRKTMRQHRLQMMKQQVELTGQDWGEYKSRMLRILQENAGEGADKDDMEIDGEPEDEEAAQIRMAMDPTYPMVLARRARRAMQRKEEVRQSFHDRVFDEFIAPTTEDDDFDDEEVTMHRPAPTAHKPVPTGRSPREDYDQWAADVAATLRKNQTTTTTSGGGALQSSLNPRMPTIIGGPRGAVPALNETPYAPVMDEYAHLEQKVLKMDAVGGGRTPEPVDENDSFEDDSRRRQRSE